MFLLMLHSLASGFDVSTFPSLVEDLRIMEDSRVMFCPLYVRHDFTLFLLQYRAELSHIQTHQTRPHQAQGQEATDPSTGL